MPGGVSEALAGLGGVLLAFTLLWAWSLKLRDASIVDPFWPVGFVVAYAAYLAAGAPAGQEDGTPRRLLAGALIGAWALRLGLHLLRRNRRHGEDPRYRAWRERGGPSWPRRSLVTVFWLQAGILWVVSLPLLGIARSGRPLSWLDGVGAAVTLAGLLVEAAADAQLRRFRADPNSRGRVLDRGLWRYSRHPNYFGNAVLWWGVYLMAVAAGAWWCWPAPLLMTWLLVRVSGVRLLEEGLRRSRPGYDDYVRRTSAFIPLPPRPSGRPGDGAAP